MVTRCGDCVLIYNNANYHTSRDRLVLRGLGRTIRQRGLRSVIRIVHANYFNFYRGKPVIGVIPSGAFCIRMGPASTRSVIQRRLIGKHGMRQLLCIGPRAGRRMPSSGRVGFCGGRLHVTLEGYNFVGPRGVSRCVTQSNCMTLNETLARVAPRSIVGRVVSDNLHNEKKNNFPANLG